MGNKVTGLLKDIYLIEQLLLMFKEKMGKKKKAISTSER